MKDEQQNLMIPWMVTGRTLLVSAPDGTVFELPITTRASKRLGVVLSDNNLWRVFFSSLLESIDNG